MSGALPRAAERHLCTVALSATVGDFVTAGTVLAEVHGLYRLPVGPGYAGTSPWPGAAIDQDPAFALRGLVDVATKTRDQRSDDGGAGPAHSPFARTPAMSPRSEQSAPGPGADSGHEGRSFSGPTVDDLPPSDR